MGLIKDFRDYRKIKSTYNLDKLTANEFQRVFDGWFNVNAEDENYVGAVYAAIDTHGLYYAKAKFRVYDESNPDDIREVNDDKIKLLFNKPNAYQTWGHMAYRLATHFSLFGNSYLYKMRQGRQIVGYQQLLPSLVTRKKEEKSKNLFDYYEFAGVRIEKSDIIDFKYPNPYSDIDGYAIINSVADNVTVNQLQMKYSKKALEKGGYLGLTFATDQDLTDSNFNKLLTQLSQRFGGEENAFKVALLASGLKPLAPPYSPKDMEFGASRVATREEIYSAFKISKILVGTGESINRATAEASIYQFTSGAIDPILTAFVDEVLTQDFKKEFGSKYRVKHDTLAPKDVEAELKYIIDNIKNGMMTRNEGRKMQGMNAAKGALADVLTVDVGGALVSVETAKQIAVEENNPNNQNNSDNPDAQI